MHHKQSELVHRFLNIEGQNPLHHINLLYDKCNGVEAGMNQWTAFTPEMHKVLLQIQQWQQEVEGLKTMPAQFENLQNRVQNLSALLQEFKATHENANTRHAAEKLANDTQFLRISGDIQQLKEWVRAAESCRFIQVETRLAHLEQNARLKTEVVSDTRALEQFGVANQQRFQFLEQKLAQLEHELLTPPAESSAHPPGMGEVAWQLGSHLPVLPSNLPPSPTVGIPPERRGVGNGRGVETGSTFRAKSTPSHHWCSHTSPTQPSTTKSGVGFECATSRVFGPRVGTSRGSIRSW